MNKTHLLHLGDSLEFIRTLKDQSVDFTFYDPPYNVGKDYETFKDDLPPDEYRQWMIDLISESRRLSRRGFGVYVGSELTKLFFELIPDAHLIPVHKKAVGPIKGNFFLQYHSLFIVGSPVIKCKDLWDDVRLPGEGFYFKEERFGDHPGQTGLAFTKKVLYHFTEVGDVFLDPFVGIGTSAVAALSMFRKIIGCELNPRYLSIARRRVKDLESQMSFIEPPIIQKHIQPDLFKSGNHK